MKNGLIHSVTRACILIASFAVLSGCGGSGGTSGSGGSGSSSGASSTYTIGGMIQGLSDAGLVLTNGSDTLKVSVNATRFIMPTAVANGANYDVTIKADPPALNCSVINGAGMVTGADVTSITVSCQPGMETILYSFGALPDAHNPHGSLIQASDGNFYGMTKYGGANDVGAVIKVTPNGSVSVLYSFKTGPTDGHYPYGNLIQARDGNFYGLTSQGGASNYGAVIKVTSNGTESLLYSFKGGTDGANPYGSLIQASDGNFYGMTYHGGADNIGTVFKITSAGVETVLHSFKFGGAVTGDGKFPYGRLVQGSDGNFYGMTFAGTYGTPSAFKIYSGVVFKITSGGTFAVLYGFGSAGTSNGVDPYGSLIQASDGDFYGMTNQGGTGNYGVVFKITPGGTLTVLYSFKGGMDGAYPYGNLIQASDGNFYGMTQYGGKNNFGTIFEITPGGTETVLYSFLGGTTDGADPYGSLIQASDGNLYGLTYEAGANNVGTVFEFK